MKAKIIFVCCFLLILCSCKKDEADSMVIKEELFSGYAQKGPFINGSSITISELDDKQNPTGRTYNTTIADNSGRFEQKNIELVSKYVALRADGFYFNEVTGERSSAQLTLNAIADITNESSVNVNVLTHLERVRIEYLVNQKQLLFTDARAQAQNDILRIFGYEKADMVNSEKLSLTSEGDDHAILFAISVIIQGFRTTADISELLADIITDIREDGELTDSSIGSKLVDDAMLFDLPKIRQNMENRYKTIGLSVKIPAFEKYVRHFLENTKFVPARVIEYPATSGYGTNILNNSVTKIFLPKNNNLGSNYSMAANLPAHTNLKVVLKGGGWAYRANGLVNWTVSPYNNGMQTFIAAGGGKNSDLNIQFSIPGTITIEYYENNATAPTRIRTLTVE